MPREIDAFQLVKTFAARNKSNAFEYSAFAQAIQRQAKSYDQSEPFYRDLALHPDGVLVPKLFQLARDGRISLQAVENRVDMIFLPEAFTEVVYAEYRRMEENPDIPFPDEDSLRLSVPPEWIQAVSVETDLPSLVGHEGDWPVPLYRLVFPEGLKPIVLLSVMVGDKLLEYAALKIRNYLRKGSNRDFIQQRLAGAFSGKDRMLKDALSAILIKPFDSVQEMRQGSGDFSYSFWAYLTSAIRKDLSSKGDPTPDDTAAYQASYVVDVFNNHFKNKAQREQERESAFKALSVALRKPPYLYAIEDVVDFRDGQGRPLLGKYTREELEAWIQERTTQAAEGFLPEILVIGSGQAKGSLVAKETLIPYIVKALREARGAVKPLITRDWRAILADFGRSASMDDDEAFKAELEKRLEANSPVLSGLLLTSLPPLVYQECRGAKEPSLDLDRCFGGSRTAGVDVLLDLDRKRLLSDVRMLLPFWYSVPVVSWIISLFVKGSLRRGAKKAAAAKPRLEAGGPPGDRPVNSRAAEFSQMARAAEQRMVPKGLTLDEHLRSLSGRWNTLLDPSAKANLTEDINSLVRDYLRTALRSMRPSSFTPERIETMSANLADRPNLLRIRNHQALEEYIRLYMVKMLKR
ncbi:MAG: hypothetical protein KKA67_10560 [Spirochaetes bacterium]|nr:hypothetical protein [Spirochaetota bacterium]MBU1080074.1 hypothetical protein [Spirochaetota bacterium]